ncbi:hypothetical protein ACFL59_15000 [Planctomycetota bacterium]
MLRRTSTSLPRFLFELSGANANRDGPRPLRLRRTKRRKIVSLRYGRFLAVEQIGFFPDHPELPDVRSRELARVVAKGANYAYDLLVRVGIAHFVECRQYVEIKDELTSRHALEIPVRTIGHLARKFVAYVQVVHEESIPLLKKDMVRRGGYILHIDGTCEEGSRVLLVSMDSLSGQVLDSKKIGSENAKEVGEALKDVRDNWGTPLSVVNDLRRSLLIAVAEVFPGVKQFVCHFHFAADVGKDILADGVDRLRRLFRTTKIRPKLGAVARSLRAFAVKSDGAHVVKAILEGLPLEPAETTLSEEEGLGVVHGLVSWILAYSRAGHGYGFPFDVPYLELYERIVAVREVLAGIRTTWTDKAERVAAELRRVHRILETVTAGEHAAEFGRIVREIRRDRTIFERLREALRICPTEGKSRRNDEGAQATLSPDRHRAILTSLRNRLEWRAKCDEGAARASRIVIDHLDKYWSYLFGHRLKEQPEIVAPRTNNTEEQQFRKVKRGCRRLHGRGRLARDVDEMPTGTILLENLKNREYCQTVYGGMHQEEIAARFSTVDPSAPTLVMEGWKKDRLTSRLPRKLERMKDLPSRLAPIIRAACGDLRGQA